MKERVLEAMKRAVETGRAAGVSLLVYQHGEEKLYCDYGFRDLENRIAMSRDTIFRMYSMSKPITSAAMMLLMSRGQVDAGSPVWEYLPEYRQMMSLQNGTPAPVRRTMTVRDLLNMTSGLPYPGDNNAAAVQADAVFRELGQRLYTDHAMTTREFARRMAKNVLAFEPGSEFMYGTSADVCGALIEEVTGKRFGAFLQEEFFGPLGMEDTDFYVPAEKQERLAKVYTLRDGKLTEFVTDHLGVTYERKTAPAFESGGAGLCSTLPDYAAFGTMLMNDGMYKGQRILPKQAIRFMHSGGLTEAQRNTLNRGWDWMGGAYTYGNFVRILTDEGMTTHFANKGEYGWDGWLGTFFSNEPESGITFVFGIQLSADPNALFLVHELKNIVMSELA